MSGFRDAVPPKRRDEELDSRSIMRILLPSTLAILCCLATADGKKIVVVGAGWGGLSAAHHLSKTPGNEVIVIDAAERPGGLVSDSCLTPGGRRAEAGQHGFWDEYHNIYKLMDDIGLDRDEILRTRRQGNTKGP